MRPFPFSLWHGDLRDIDVQLRQKGIERVWGVFRLVAKKSRFTCQCMRRNRLTLASQGKTPWHGVGTAARFGENLSHTPRTAFHALSLTNTNDVPAEADDQSGCAAALADRECEVHAVKVRTPLANEFENVRSEREAGPARTAPLVENCEPWHGQTKREAVKPSIVQVSCVQVEVITL